MERRRPPKVQRDVLENNTAALEAQGRAGGEKTVKLRRLEKEIIQNKERALKLRNAQIVKETPDGDILPTDPADVALFKESLEQ